MRKFPIYALAFLHSLASAMLGRGVFFVTSGTFGFSDAQQLWISLGCGLVYIVGALASRRCAHSLGSRTHVLIVAATLGILSAISALSPVPVTVVIVTLLGGVVFGTFWPILESYVAGGESPEGMIRSIGRFNLSWSSAIPAGLAIAGALSAWNIRAFFGACVLTQAVAVWAALRLPPSPEVHDVFRSSHQPASPPSWAGLLRAHRALMIAAYVAAFAVQPLLPAILTDLAVHPRWQGFCAGILDCTRLAVFWAGGYWAVWHGKRGLVVATAIAVPLGFIMILAGSSVLASVLIGQVVFGFGAGAAYYGSLYYALTIHRGAVEAGGTHEALIGSAFSLGPALGLVGLWAMPGADHSRMGILLMILPCLLVASFFSLFITRHHPSRPSIQHP